MAYLLSNICTKHYQNRTPIADIIVGGWVVFLFWDAVYLDIWVVCFVVRWVSILLTALAQITRVHGRTLFVAVLTDTNFIHLSTTVRLKTQLFLWLWWRHSQTITVRRPEVPALLVTAKVTMLVLSYLLSARTHLRVIDIVTSSFAAFNRTRVSE